MKKRNIGVPEWAKDAIWYQIFPERFRNGDPANDPKPEDTGSEKVAHWRICPWGMDWYDRAEWEPPLGDFYRSVYHRRFGGDLIGIREKLDYLQDLGVNALYLNPVFMAESLHKYDGSSFHHIDPTFGPDRAGDLKALAAARETDDPKTWIWTAADKYLLELVKEIHRRGMRVILDGVFNHTGRRFFAFQDLLKHGKKSRYRDWYQIEKWNPDGTFAYKGWFGHAGLPELGRNTHHLNPPVRDYIFNITRRWMDPDGDGHPADGIDGWRLDVAFCVPAGFWQEWRKLVKSINPEAYLTGEIVALAREYLQGDQFDAVMNYMWLFPAVSFFSPGKSPTDSRTLKQSLNRLRRAYPEDVHFVLQNLLDSHDVARIATMLENPDTPKAHWDDYFNTSRVKHQPGFITTRPGPKAWQALRQIVIFQMTYPGAPMIYYGTEVGMWGANDPDNRQPMFWADVDHQSEKHAYHKPGAVRDRKPDMELLAFFQKAMRLRRQHRVLRRGSLRWLKTDSDRLLGFERFDPESRVRVYLNASDKPITFRLREGGLDLWEEGKPVTPGPITVEPRGWRVVDLTGPRKKIG